MFNIEKWQEIIGIIRQHKLRTFLTAFGVFWGIFMLIILLGAGTGLENGVTGMFRGFASNAVYVWTRSTTKPYQGLKAGRRWHMTTDDMQALRDQVPEIQHLAPRMWTSVDQVMRGTKSGAFQVMGETPDFIKVQSKNLYNGRFINDLDVSEKRKVAAIGERVAEVLFQEGENPVGQYIKLSGTYFQVVGVFKSWRSGESANDDNESIHIPLTVAQQMNNSGNRIGWVALTAYPHCDAAVVEQKIKSVLAKRHKIAPDDKRAVGSWNTAEEFSQFTNMFTGIRLFTWMVGFGTLAAGIVGVSNIMLITVRERTREFGLRKALGATPWSIVSLVLQEAVVLTAIAGYSGLVVGVALVEGVGTAMDQMGVQPDYFSRPEVDFTTAMTATAILVVVGALAGIIPASQAANIKPIEALRSE